MGSHLKASERLFSYIKSKEKFTSPARVLPGDRPDVVTGAWGQTGLRIGQIVTPAEGEAWLHAKVAHLEDVVNSSVTVELTQNEFDPLLSFSYNVGLGNPHSHPPVEGFLTSTLRKRLNAGDKVGASREFLRWIRAAGKILPGLVTRRKEEQAWFLEK